METRGGRVHHAYGRCAPYIRNSRTIHAVPMHHHSRFCCSLGAAYALYNSRISNTHNTAAVLKLEDLEKRIQLSNESINIGMEKKEIAVMWAMRKLGYTEEETAQVLKTAGEAYSAPKD